MVTEISKSESIIRERNKRLFQVLENYREDILKALKIINSYPKHRVVDTAPLFYLLDQIAHLFDDLEMNSARIHGHLEFMSEKLNLMLKEIEANPIKRRKIIRAMNGYNEGANQDTLHALLDGLEAYQDRIGMNLSIAILRAGERMQSEEN